MHHFTGKQYLYIDLANQLGFDKEDWSTRLAEAEWALENWGSAYAHEKYNPLLTKAYLAIQKASQGKWIGHAMALDSTASGLQIMAALTGCEKTAQNVNLCNTGKREDVYRKMAAEMSSVEGEFTRTHMKQPIMTHFYGSKKQPKKIFGEGTPELARFYQTLRTELPGAEQLMEDMQSCWDPEATEYRWTMPDGHVVISKVMVPVTKRVEIDELNHHKFSHRAYLNKPSPTGLSLAANIIHSFDGYVVRQMYRKADAAGIQMGTIHDSFWAHPNDMNHIRQFYVDILVELADSNYLENVFREVTGNPNIEYTKSYGLSKHIKESEYALS